MVFVVFGLLSRFLVVGGVCTGRSGGRSRLLCDECKLDCVLIGCGAWFFVCVVIS